MSHSLVNPVTDYVIETLQGRRQVKTCGEDTHGERGVRTYNESPRAEPSGGVDSGTELLDARRQQHLILRIL